MISLTFNGSDDHLLAELNAAPGLLESAVRSQIDAENTAMQAIIVGEKLSGEVLQHRTGQLAASVRVLPAESDGGAVTGYVQAGGGTAFYGKFQEEGTKRWYDILPVNKAALAFFPSGSEGAGITSQVAQVLYGGKRGVNRKLKNTPAALNQFAQLGGIVVKKVHHPPIAERSFLRSTQDEQRGQVLAGLETAVAEALQRVA